MQSNFNKAAKAHLEFPRWHVKSAEIRSALSITGDFMPWTGPPLKGSTLGIIGDKERALDVINVAWADRLQQMPLASVEAAKVGFFANYSQCVSRRPWGRPPTLTRRTELFSFEGGFVLTGYDHLAAMGYGHLLAYSNSDTLTERDARDLCGEAFSVPCISTAIAGFFLNRHAPWWHQV